MDSFSLGIFLSLFTALCWGSSVILYKKVLKSESPYVSIIIRGISAVGFILIILLIMGGLDSFKMVFQKEVFFLILISGMLNGIGEILYFEAIKISKASIIQAPASTASLFIVIILVFIGIEPISILIIIGIIFIVIGVGIISQKDENDNTTEEIKSNRNYKGILLALLASVIWSFSLIIVRIIIEFSVDSYSLAALRYFFATISTTLIWITVVIRKRKINSDKPTHSISLKNIILLVIGGILSWGIGSVAYFESIRLIGISRATPITAINPFITALLGILILKEKLNKYQVLGILIIIIGCIFVTIG